MRPFLHWAGGKGRIGDFITALFPEYGGRYIEPFLGGGAIALKLAPPRAVLSDANAELISTWIAIRESPEAVVEAVSAMPRGEDAYYEIRGRDCSHDPIAAAARMIYLNKQGFNGLYRVNKNGAFNVPFGRKEGKEIIGAAVVSEISGWLRRSGVEIHCRDFATTIDRAEAGDLVYCDPPYASPPGGAVFRGYRPGGFGDAEQDRLARVARRAADRGAAVFVSNSDTEDNRRRFDGWHAHEISAPRTISCKGDRRTAAREVLFVSPGSGQRGDLPTP